ncbi:hypothetical protein SDC9_04020 [bioreactor metagenome]|uniref:Calcineurin-like phosphoesterase domain-containing protein n=1 Tax=bioreactor metagenome TaxID=1076179 RepID=A0A644SW49_9ZZZZ|nr:DNA repair exonuclease [Negativicutes bacterium]
MNRTVPFKFIHCADLHLATPFEGVFDKVPPQIGTALREATFQAFEKVIQAAVEHQVDFVVVAGDVYDGVRHSTRAQIRFAEALEILDSREIKSVIAHGNHDPLEAWYAQYRLPASVHRFGDQAVECVPIMKDGQTIANIYGISHGKYNVEENLAKHFTTVEPAVFSVGVLHCNVGNLNDDRYAPCTLEDLRTAGIDYWALGHVHTRKILQDKRPCVIYPGNTQGVSIREIGPRGCCLVAVDEHRNVVSTFIDTDIIRWEKREVSINEMTELHDVMMALRKYKEEVRGQAEGRGTILRVGLIGRGPLDSVLRGTSKVMPLSLEEDLMAQLRLNEEKRSDFVWLESLQVQTRPAIDIEVRRTTPDFVGDFLRRSAEMRESLAGLGPSEQREALQKVISGFLAKRQEFNKISFMLEQMTADDLMGLLEEAETLGLNLLVEGEET